MRKFAPPAWFFSALAVLTLIAAFAYADKTRLHWYAEERSTPTVPAVAAVKRDRVVGVLAKCSGGSREYSGDACYDTTYAAVRATARLVVTVRTASGATYTVEMPISTRVSVGDPWP
jgi:hypothetical protein